MVMCIRCVGVLSVRDIQRHVSCQPRHHDGACAVRTAAHRALYSAWLWLRRLFNECCTSAGPGLLRPQVMSAPSTQLARRGAAVSTWPHHVPRRILPLCRRYVYSWCMSIDH